MHNFEGKISNGIRDIGSSLRKDEGISSSLKHENRGSVKKERELVPSCH